MRFENRTSPPAEADLTPMIDMTFQLIAFFMVLINFSQSEQNDKVVLPTSELARPAEAPPEHTVIIHLTSDGSLSIRGQQVELDGLKSRLNPEIALLQLEGKTAADANIVIRGHRTAPGGSVQDLINRCQKLGFEKFALRAKEEM